MSVDTSDFFAMIIKVIEQRDAEKRQKPHARG